MLGTSWGLRKMHRHAALSAIVLFTLPLVPTTSAEADELELEYLGVAGGGIALEIRAGAVVSTRDVGRSDWAFSDGASWGAPDLSTFTLDLTTGPTDETFALASMSDDGQGLSDAQVQVMAEHFERNYAQAVRFDVPGGSDIDLAEAAAFQMVLWEVTQESSAADGASAVASSIDISSGRVTFDAVHEGSHAGLFGLAADIAIAWSTELASLSSFDSTLAQHLIGMRSYGRASQPTHVTMVVAPSPKPFVLAAIGVIGVIVLRRKMLAA
mgnify:FL=1